MSDEAPEAEPMNLLTIRGRMVQGNCTAKEAEEFIGALEAKNDTRARDLAELRGEHRKREIRIESQDSTIDDLHMENHELRSEVERLKFQVADHHAAAYHWNRLRPAVQSFVRWMEETLRENDHKPGWHADRNMELMKRLDQEAVELRSELQAEQQNARKIVKEAADVANFAMMIADNVGRTKEDG